MSALNFRLGSFYASLAQRNPHKARRILCIADAFLSAFILRVRFGLRRCCAAFQRGGNASLLKKCNGETLTVNRVGLHPGLIKAFAATNLTESCFSQAAELIRRVKRWRSGRFPAVQCRRRASLLSGASRECAVADTGADLKTALQNMNLHHRKATA